MENIVPKGPPLFVRDKKIFVVSEKFTWFEALAWANRNGYTIAENNPFFNRLFLDKDGNGKYLPIPEEIVKFVYFDIPSPNTPKCYDYYFSGTAFALPRKGKAFENYIEREYPYGRRKLPVVFKVPEDYAGITGKMITCDQGFDGNGVPKLSLLTSENGEPIIDPNNAERMFFEFNSREIREFEVTRRIYEKFEEVGDESTALIALSQNSFGFLSRGEGSGFIDYEGRIPVGAMDIAQLDHIPPEDTVPRFKLLVYAPLVEGLA